MQDTVFTKLSDTFDELILKREAVVGEVSAQDLCADSELPGLTIMEKIESAAPRCTSLQKIGGISDTKDGDGSDARSLKYAIDGAPPDLEVPIAILKKIPSRAAVECGEDLETLQQICDTGTFASHDFAIGRLDIPESDKVELAESIMMSCFCNFARDPSTPDSQMRVVMAAMERVCTEPTTFGVDVQHVHELFQDPHPSRFPKVSDALDRIKDPTCKFHKPFQVKWPVLQAARSNAAALKLVVESQATQANQAAVLEKQVDDISKAIADEGIRPTVARLYTIRGAATALKTKASSQVVQDSEPLFEKIENIMQQEFDIVRDQENAAFLAKLQPIISEVIHSLDAMETQTVESLMPRWKSWVAKLEAIKPKSAVAAGIKGFAPDSASAEWQSIYDGRTRLLLNLPGILALIFKSTGGNVMLADNVPKDAASVITEFNAIVARCGQSNHKLLYIPDADLADQFHTALTKYIPAGTLNYAIFKVIIAKIRGMGK